MRFQLKNGWTANIVQPNPALLSLLQFADKDTAEAILAAYLPPVNTPEKVHILNWEIFSEQEYFARKQEEARDKDKESLPKKKARGTSRTLAFIESLRPTQYAVGTTFDRRRRYVVALFDQVVIAESTAYGNAVYVTHREGWGENLSRSKAYCLRQGGQRIIHSDGWERRLRMAVEAFLT